MIMSLIHVTGAGGAVDGSKVAVADKRRRGLFGAGNGALNSYRISYENDSDCFFVKWESKRRMMTREIT